MTTIFSHVSLGYIVQKKPAGAGDDDWVACNDWPVSGCEFQVGNLPEGADLEFRVLPVNAAGNGKPSGSTGPVKVKERKSRWRCWYIYLCIYNI